MKYRLRIEQDEDAFNPRDNDNLGTMVLWTRDGYGDKHDFKRPDDFLAWWKRNGRGGVLLPVYMYAHSSVGFSVNGDIYPFNCPWDGGQSGWIYVTAPKLRKEYSVKRLDAGIRELAKRSLIAEVEEYNSFSIGECYGFIVERHDESLCDFIGEDDAPCATDVYTCWIEVDSCWGFIGPLRYYDMVSGLKDIGIFDHLDEAHRAILGRGDFEQSEVSGAVVLTFEVPDEPVLAWAV